MDRPLHIASPFSDVTELLDKAIFPDYDVRINDTCVVRAHRAILGWRVPYFEKLYSFLQDGLGASMEGSDASRVDVHLHNTDVTSAHVAVVLRYIYGGGATVHTLADVPPILAVASYFLLDDFCTALRTVVAEGPTTSSELLTLRNADALLLNALAASDGVTLCTTQHLAPLLELAVVGGSVALLNALVSRFLNYALCPEVYEVAVAHDVQDLAEYCLRCIARNVRIDLEGHRHGDATRRLCLPRMPHAEVELLLHSDHLNVHSEAEVALLVDRVALCHPQRPSLRACVRSAESGLDRGVLHEGAMRLLVACTAVVSAAVDKALHVTIKLAPVGMCAQSEWEVERLRVMRAGGGDVDWTGGEAAVASSGDYSTAHRDFSCANLLRDNAGMTWSAPPASADASFLLLRLPVDALEGAVHLTFPQYSDRPTHVRVLVSRDGEHFTEAHTAKVTPTRTNIVDLKEAGSTACRLFDVLQEAADWTLPSSP